VTRFALCLTLIDAADFATLGYRGIRMRHALRSQCLVPGIKDRTREYPAEHEQAKTPREIFFHSPFHHEIISQQFSGSLDG
jgi:hypothetical protein